MPEEHEDYDRGRHDFLTGDNRFAPGRVNALERGYIDALADTVRDLAVAVSLMMGDGNADVDVGALRERLSQIRPRQER